MHPIPPRWSGWPTRRWRACPSIFRALLGNVVLRVVEEAEDEVLAELELESPMS
jgi:predicted Zn-dependent protease with MMP-like domain